MKILKTIIFFMVLLTASASKSQFVGIGTTSPTEKLEVSGKVKANSLILNSGGTTYDYLMKNSATGEVGFRKAHGGIGLNYIICINGAVPSPNGEPLTVPFLGEIKLFAGNFAPEGWAFCQGQWLAISQNPDLYSLLGTMYGGNGQSTFALPDLRGTVAVGSGVAMPAGYQWAIGERVN